MKTNVYKTLITLTITLSMLLGAPESAYSNINKLMSGTAKTVSSVFYIPAEIIKDSGQVMFPFGLVTGTVKGAFKTVGGLLAGGLDLACGAAPYAKYLVFLLILPIQTDFFKRQSVL